jgi:hypothetical protein
MVMASFRHKRRSSWLRASPGIYSSNRRISMASVNKVIIVGNLGRDPEVRTLSNGDAVANIAVATSYKSTDKDTGEQKESTEWHRIAFFGRLAEIAGQYLKKGAPRGVARQLIQLFHFCDGHGCGLL